MSEQLEAFTGYRALLVTDSQLQLTFPVHVLYPTKEVAQAVSVGLYQLEVAPAAPVLPGSFPLVLVSHGTGSSGLLHRQLAQALVRAGYVVALPEHPHNNRDDDSWANTPQNLLARPRHLQLALDQLQADTQLRPVLRPGVVALIGHSLGGYSALALAGGQPVALTAAGSDQRAIPVPAADERVKALVLLAPAVPWYAPPGALARVRVPILLLAGEKDEHTPPQQVELVVKGVPSATQVTFRVIANAGHFSFLTPFPPHRTTPAFAPSQDPPGFDRQQFQQVLARQVVDFLRQQLGA